MTVRSGEFVVEHLTKNRTGEPIDDEQTAATIEQ